MVPYLTSEFAALFFNNPYQIIQYSIHTTEALKHRDEALKHRTEAIKHRDEAIKHRGEALKHRADALKHRDEALKHRAEGQKHRIDGYLVTTRRIDCFITLAKTSKQYVLANF